MRSGDGYVRRDGSVVVKSINADGRGAMCLQDCRRYSPSTVYMNRISAVLPLCERKREASRLYRSLVPIG